MSTKAAVFKKVYVHGSMEAYKINKRLKKYSMVAKKQEFCLEARLVGWKNAKENKSSYFPINVTSEWDVATKAKHKMWASKLDKGISVKFRSTTRTRLRKGSTTRTWSYSASIAPRSESTFGIQHKFASKR
jgi:hypothetical protein